MFHGRKKPYTVIGITRVPCARCGQPSSQQWQICSNNRNYLGFCEDCDVAMNAMVLAFLGFENADELLANYIKDIGYDGSHPAFTVHVQSIGLQVPAGSLAPRHGSVDLYEVGAHSETHS